MHKTLQHFRGGASGPCPCVQMLMLPNTTVVELYLYSVGVAIEMWPHNDFGQIIHTGVHLSPSSVIWYWPKALML